ncbi:hypothetical protein [Rhizobium leguminosarum]|jgi:hypothetical protein|uniref:Ankyrin repeat domain-containing protein n=1 Tax=Rhizobium leguminosarum TaxID=384 RepID=A0ABD7PVZ3_RHILE|nr:hypothetical protein [Rhizobium leguminosarum]TAV75085.1 hypothetical protein ELI28_16860 [Rhizobium leguminosarum]TAV79684.1 hypothetical protein ELI27_16845 [Rhizobium leguminosarum]TAW31020.1 hypothetical protein ELI19_16615 [Rhizobium leguminosarum]TAW44747.1 hypothetical protein ELI18_16570 [Rhizobium leguminosarum]TAZ31416.1 hypothetical protein ELH73_16825 [Rhizobium leguminosarum]
MASDVAMGKRFDAAMFDIYRRAKSEAKYNATVFLKMLNDRGGLETAKFLINADKQSDGFTALHLAGRLDLTVEAMIIEDARWHSLFSPDEIAKAKRRLQLNGYTPR